MFLFFFLMMSIFAYINIPKEIFPPIQMDKVSITGGYAGTSADVLDKMVVKSLEDDLKNLNDIDAVKTTIKNGSFSIMADVKHGADSMNALNEVKDVIASIRGDLPSDMLDPIAKVHKETIPLALIAIAGDKPTRELIERAEELKSSLSAFKDLSEITLRGDSDDELLFSLNEEKIRAMGLDFNSVVLSLQSLSSIFPIGTIKEKGKHLYISTYNGEKSAQEINDSLLSIGDIRVRVGDIADVSFELADKMEISHFNGQRNVSINITKSKHGNAIELSSKIREMLAEYSLKYPEFTFEIYTDTSIWIKNRLNTVVANIAFGLIMVFISMLIFVNRGIALVVTAGIPLSFMIGLIVTEKIGYSLNMLSLMGALIALGMLVDEAIVVAENIYRHLEEGQTRREAAILGAVEMFPAVLTATLTTIFAFLPMLMITGEMGMFIKILPIMISVLLVSSLFEAFYFLPLHSYDFLRLRKEGHSTHVIWEKLYTFYDYILHTLFKRKILSIVLITISILGITVALAASSRFQLIPDFDTTQIYVTGKVNVNNDLEDTEVYVSKIEKILLQNLDKEDMSSVTSVVGFKLDAKNKAELGEHLFHVFIDLHERAPENFFNRYINPIFSIGYDVSLLKRERPAVDIAKDITLWMEELKKEEIDGKLVFEEFSIDVPGAGIVAHDVEIQLSGKSNSALAFGVQTLQDELSKIEGISNITTDTKLGERELKLRVNAYGKDLGFTEQSINQELRAFYLKGEYSKMFDDQGLIKIKMQGSARDKLQSIHDFQVHVPNSQSYVALHDVCEFIFIQGYVSINKEDAQRIRAVYSSMDKEVVMASEVMIKLEGTIQKLKEEGYRVNIKGEQAENEKTQREMSQAALMAIILIFITLVWLFNSFFMSLIVLSTIPLVILGVLLGHIVMGLNLSMFSMIGLTGLTGVVVNDGLIMVQFIKKATDLEDLMRLAKTRLRPILLTSITTVIGLSTLIFFAAGQALILQPMAISLGFGVAWATVLNLVYVPLLYAVIFRVKAKS